MTRLHSLVFAAAALALLPAATPLSAAALSHTAHVTRAAPMSWIPTTRPPVISSRQHSMRTFSVKGSPTWTVGRFSSVASENSSEAMVAPTKTPCSQSKAS